MRLQRALVAAAAALTFLAGCSSESSADPQGFNDADVDFATDMIQHHAQALEMVDMTVGRELDPEVAALAEQIRAAQAPEIEQMADLLEEWDEPVPETSRDHANAHAEGHGGGGDMDADMPGMLGTDELETLRVAPPEQFETMFLSLMIEHHQGAVTMAEEVVENGQNAETEQLAQEIIDAQQAEIAHMQGLLRD